MKKNLIYLLITLVLGTVIGFLVPLLLADRTSGAEVDPVKLKQVVQQEYKADMIRSYIESYEAEQIRDLQAAYIAENGTSEGMPVIKPLTNQEKEDLVAAIMADDNSAIQGEGSKPAAKPEGAVESQMEEPAEAEIDKEPTGNEVKDDRIQQIIDANRDYIDPGELTEGADIFNRLDTGYLFGLSGNGLTVDEKRDVESYLHSQLNDQEYTTAITLYMKYSGLLN